MERILSFVFMIAAIAFFLWVEIRNVQKSKSQSQDKSVMPTEASIILAELTRLEINQAEIIKQIDRIESGDADILYTHITTSTGVQLLSQESFLSALKQEKKMLSAQILEKSLEFSKIMGRVGQNGGTNSRTNGRTKGNVTTAGKCFKTQEGSGKCVNLNRSDLEELQQLLQSGSDVRW